MSLKELNSDQAEIASGAPAAPADTSARQDVSSKAATIDGAKTVSPGARVTVANRQSIDSVTTPGAEASALGKKSARPPGSHWWLFASISALLLTILTVAAVYLITKKPSTVDQLVILTVPSGAEIKLDSKDYGNSPVKLEQVQTGTYTLTITKEGYEPIVEQINIFESTPLEFKLKQLPPPEVIGLSPEEAIKRYREGAEQAFASAHYGTPYEESALYYVNLLLGEDPSNQFALELKGKVQKALHQSAQAAMSRGDVAQAQEIYSTLVDNYPEDQEARTAAAKLEAQLSSRHGEVRDLVRKAEEALKAGNLIEPARTSAYYYSKQALAIDRQNAQARTVRNQVKESLVSEIEQASARGDLDAAIKQLEQTTQFFPEEKQLRVKLRELTGRRTSEAAKAADPKLRRLQGLAQYRREEFAEAIPNLEVAVLNGLGSAEVVFALARSLMKLGQLDEAASYYRKVPPTAGDTYRSSIAALGDIAHQRGDTAAALDRYKEAQRLGGSTLYSISTLDDKIERIENRQREKAAEPIPATIQVKHLHGGLLKGSCGGTLTVNSTGVRFEGSEHVFSSNLMGVNVRITKDELILQFPNKPEKFRAAGSDAERLRETLARYQAYFSVKK